MTTSPQAAAVLAPSPAWDVLVNFCTTVLRSDEERLRLAMWQYQQALAAAERRG